jgi:hypothetical protein
VDVPETQAAMLISQNEAVLGNMASIVLEVNEPDCIRGNLHGEVDGSVKHIANGPTTAPSSSPSSISKQHRQNLRKFDRGTKINLKFSCM